MTVQEAIEILRDTPIDIRSTREDDIHTLYATAQGMAIEALQQVTGKLDTPDKKGDVMLELPYEQVTSKLNSDCISRQAAIDAIRIFYADECALVDSIEEQLEKLPTAQPQRIKGRWIEVTNGRGGHECNQCHNYAPSWQTGEERLTNYCPNCGADMREGGNNVGTSCTD